MASELLEPILKKMRYEMKEEDIVQPSDPKKRPKPKLSYIKSNMLYNFII
jgi:hypothetical protein